ncbi:MAG: hypothetical protein LBD75_04015 [Candidatus Peribacteria bacterium]|jgi:hypothetical protein|nr:hypothetical protein [Candidatus Peribacteria bacterium]
MTTKSFLTFATVLAVSFTFSIFTLAAMVVPLIDDQITDTLNQKQQEELLQQTKTLNEKFTFTQVTSCQSMDSVFTDFLETYKKYYLERTPYDRADIELTNSVSFGTNVIPMPILADKVSINEDTSLAETSTA